MEPAGPVRPRVPLGCHRAVARARPRLFSLHSGEVEQSELAPLPSDSRRGARRNSFSKVWQAPVPCKREQQGPCRTAIYWRDIGAPDQADDWWDLCVFEGSTQKLRATLMRPGPLSGVALSVRPSMATCLGCEPSFSASPCA